MKMFWKITLWHFFKQKQLKNLKFAEFSLKIDKKLNKKKFLELQYPSQTLKAHTLICHAGLATETVFHYFFELIYDIFRNCHQNNWNHTSKFEKTEKTKFPHN